MRRITLIISSFLLLYIGLAVYAFRGYYSEPFDKDYWKDKYEHSQWRMPLSPRTLGDDGLYLFEGYRLAAQSADPSLSNAEMPPFGKYLIGFTVLGTGNAHVFGLASTFFYLSAFMFLAYMLTGSTRISLVSGLLLLTDPLVTGQLTLTMLDTLQAGFILLSLAIGVRMSRDAQSTPSVSWIVLLGVINGFALGAKTPVLTAPFVFLTSIAIAIRYRNPVLWVIHLLSVLLSYMAPYAIYFIKGNSLLDWLGLQKWIVSFYRSSLLEPQYLSALTTLVTGRITNLFTLAKDPVGEFTLAWPIILLASIVSSARIGKNRTQRFWWAFITSYSLLIFIILNVIPFWTRYLIVLLPFLYLLAIRLFLARRFGWIALSILLTANLVSARHVLFPPPDRTVDQFVYDWTYGYFQDMYERTDQSTKDVWSRLAFNRRGKELFHQGEIEAAYIERLYENSNPSAGDGYTVRVTYHTKRLGSFSRLVTLEPVQEQGRWRIRWNWDTLIEGIGETGTLRTDVSPATRGTIIKGSRPIAWDAEAYEISIVPDQLDKTQEDEIFQLISSLFDGSLIPIAIHQRVYGNSVPGIPVAIGTPAVVPGDPAWEKLTSYSGIILTPSFARYNDPDYREEAGKVENTVYIECCSKLYSPTTYTGVSGLEKEHNEELKAYAEGSLTVQSKDQEEAPLLQSTGINGSTVRI